MAVVGEAEFANPAPVRRSVPDFVGNLGAEAHYLSRRPTRTATSAKIDHKGPAADVFSAKKLGDAANMSKPDKSERQDGRYKADITAGSLKLAESRRIAELLLQGVDVKGWNEAILDRNVLQIRSPATAKRMASFIRARLKTMGPELWKLVRDAQGTVATHAIFAAALKHSPLLGDFVELVVGEQRRRFAPILPLRLFDEYLEGCRERDHEMVEWNEATRKRLRSSVYQILAQAAVIDNTKSLKLQPVFISDQVLSYLKAERECYVLRCMTACQ